MIKPEQLKLIAEALGYERPIDVQGCVQVNCKVQNMLPTTLYEEFNPYTNAEQREEILLWTVKTMSDDDALDFVEQLQMGRDYTELLLNRALQQVGE